MNLLNCDITIKGLDYLNRVNIERWRVRKKYYEHDTVVLFLCNIKYCISPFIIIIGDYNPNPQISK